jgi:hypothetical protein
VTARLDEQGGAARWQMPILHGLLALDVGVDDRLAAWLAGRALGLQPRTGPRVN